ncbi:MAG: alpha-L-fucosidase [Treponema sp.]|nr:alpha-L-fucosidase [Treponema sp.]
MHIEEWDSEFLSKFDPDAYFNNLKEANINAPMIYLQSHVGLCYWPAKSGKMHEGFKGREDTMRRLVDKCHEAGMDVIAYYSLIYNNWAYKQQPEWQMRDVHNHGSRFDGSRYGLCCPNSRGYRNFIAEQIAEFSAYFQFEGIFLDMTFWPMVCYCDNCRKRWEEEVGGEMPVVIDWNDPDWVKFQRKRIEWLGEFAQFATAEVKKHKPGCTVEHQYSTALHFWRFGVTENITLASDYAGGDLYGGIAEQSFACKLYYNLTRNQPFEYMTSRCYTTLAEHTTNKSMDLLKLSVMLTYLHHGACLLIDAIDPAGTIDHRVYKKIGRIFREAEAYEPYLSIGRHSYDVGLYFNMFAKMDTLANGIPVDKLSDNGNVQPHEEAVMEAANTLRVHHIAYSVINNWQLDLLNAVKVLVLADVPFLSEAEIDAIKRYIKNGGSAYISGRTAPLLIEEIFKIRYENFSEHRVTYVSPTEEGAPVFRGEYTKEYPLAMFEPQPLYSGKPGGRVMGTITLPYTIPNPKSNFSSMSPETGDVRRDLNAPQYKFASIHSNPPGIFTDRLAMIMTEYGKGKVFYSTLPIERAKREQHSDIFAGIIKMLMNGRKPVFSTDDAPEPVEFILFEDSEKKIKLLGLINIQESFHTIPVHNFTVSVYSETSPREVLVLPDKKPIPFVYENNLIKIHIADLYIYAMIFIQY